MKKTWGETWKRVIDLGEARTILNKKRLCSRRELGARIISRKKGRGNRRPIYDIPKKLAERVAVSAPKDGYRSAYRLGYHLFGSRYKGILL